MVYTDAPGALGTSPQVNDLNLQAVVGSSTYNGNVFSGQYSVTGGAPDPSNNYESVFLPAGTSGAITATVTGFNIAGDGVPGTGDATDQDFAFVCYNCATCAATITTDRTGYGCASAMNITLADSDLKGTGTQTISVRSTTETTPESVLLTESPAGSGYFVTSYPTYSGAAVHGDGRISVANGGTVTLSYTDASACGTANVLVQKTLPVDCVTPAITNVQSGNLTGSSAQVTWTTSEAADSRVTFGPVPPPPATTPPINPTPTTGHSYPLSGLSACSTYAYSVASADAAGNTASANNGGTYYLFTTTANVQPNYSYPGAPVAIPDNNPTGASATINVPDNKSILDVNVSIGSISHTYDDDLVIHLIGPDNTDVILSNRHGGSSNNYTNTVFDDAATTLISAGLPPFTGTFKPDNPLSAFNGKIAAGAWRLYVQDLGLNDVGTIDHWTLNLTYPNVPCSSHVSYNTHTLVSDICSTGGAGGNGIWEPGEQVNFKINLRSDGTTGVTGVSATVTPTTPGVTMVSASTTYPDIAAGATADQFAPYFSVKIPAGMACGSTVSFQLSIKTNQGSWLSTFSQTIGNVSGGCTQTVCPAMVKPVSGLRGSRGIPAATTINLTWNVATCHSTGYHLLYGNLATVATYAISGAVCALDVLGNHTWNGVPAGNLWYVVVPDNVGSTEGSWGLGVGGGQEGGSTASGQCGYTVRDNSGTCP
jgi:subtilisin-like proprotein convertase family protein